MCNGRSFLIVWREIIGIKFDFGNLAKPGPRLRQADVSIQLLCRQPEHEPDILNLRLN